MLLDKSSSEARDAAQHRSQRLAKYLWAMLCLVITTCVASIGANIYYYKQLSDVQMSLATLKQASETVLLPVPSGANGTISQIRTSVHLGLSGSVILEARDCKVANEIETWRPGVNGHVRGDVSVKLGRMRVTRTGIYQLYCQVSWQERNSSSTSIPTRLHLMIVRDNPLLHVVGDVLLKIGTTRCKDLPGQQNGCCGSCSPTSYYVGGAMQMFKGDEVYVKTSCIGNLKDDDAETYFGMYMV